MEPPLVFAAIPDAIFGSEHPPPSLAVEHRKVSDRQPERSRQQAARAPLCDQKLVADLGFGEGIDCHAESIACDGGRIQDRRGEGCRIRFG